MNRALEQKNFNIDFYQLVHKPTAQLATPSDAFDQMINKTLPTVASIMGFTREIWNLNKRGNNYAFQLRKFRTNNLPQVGTTGFDAVDLQLAARHGLIELNYAMYFPARQILAWCQNSHGSAPAHLAKFLSDRWSNEVTISPILQADAIARLMRGGIQLKKIELTIPRPTNPDLYPAEQFNQSLIDMLREGRADSIHITMGIDGRRKDSAGTLMADLKRTLTEAAGLGASTAKAIVFDNGVEHPIDLLTDRVRSTQQVLTDVRYPPSATMYDAIERAHHESEGAINGYFGALGNAVV